MESLLKSIDSLNYAGMKYDEIMEVFRIIEEKASMYEKRANQLKEKKDVIKEILRLRMIEEKLEQVNTPHGHISPKIIDSIAMKNFDLFLEWLREGFLLDMAETKTLKNDELTRDELFYYYKTNDKLNDRLHYLKQSCFNSTKLKAMHKDPDDTLPPGIGVFQKYDLSIVKAKKNEKV